MSFPDSGSFLSLVLVSPPTYVALLLPAERVLVTSLLSSKPGIFHIFFFISAVLVQETKLTKHCRNMLKCSKLRIITEGECIARFLIFRDL